VKTFTTEDAKVHKGKPQRKPRKKLPKKRKSGMPSENLHHRGQEGTQRKTTEETVEKTLRKRKSGMPSENLHHRGHEGTQRKTTELSVEKKYRRTKEEFW